MKVLITGGAGYVGNELTFQLLKDPEIEQIVIYDNLSRKNYNLFLDTKYPEGKVKFVKGELLDTRKIKSVLKEVDVVYHLAAKVTTPFAIEDSHLFEQINHWGTAELVYAVEECDNISKFIFTSSTSVYGASTEMLDINSTPQPRTYYGNSKYRSEAHVRRLAGKLPAYILRCGNIYGYSPSLRFDAVINSRIQISGNGMQHRAFIHVDKAVNVLCNLLHKDLPPGTYNLVDRNMTINEIADVVKEIYPSLEILFINQHLTMRELMVLQDDRLNPVITREDISFKDEMLSFKERFAFAS